MIELLIGAAIGVFGTMYCTNKDVKEKTNAAVKDTAYTVKDGAVKFGKWVKKSVGKKSNKKSEDK